MPATLVLECLVKDPATTRPNPKPQALNPKPPTVSPLKTPHEAQEFYQLLSQKFEKEDSEEEMKTACCRG